MTRVAVVGRDAALWLTALALRRAFAPVGVEVAAVELPTALGDADVYPTLPAIEALHARIGIGEAALLRSVGGVFSHGCNVREPDGNAFFLGFGTHGSPVRGAAFFPVWTMARRHGLNARLQDFSLVAAAATNGRLLLADDETATYGRADYGYGLPARPYVAALKAAAPRLGVACVTTPSCAPRLRDDGDIEAIVLSGGERLDADLFVDATGSAALLRTALGADREDWSEAFPADRVIVARMPPVPGPPPYAELRIGEAGWLRLQPAMDDLRIVYGYASTERTESTALEEMRRLARGPVSDPSVRRSHSGRLDAPWSGNCVAIGDAACSLDPALGYELHVAQLGIVHLLSLFPTDLANPVAERAEYNRLLGSSLDRLRDAAQTPYALSPWPGRFWDRGRAGPIPASLGHRIATFRARGEVVPLEDETLDPAEWQALLVGLGVRPTSWPPSVDLLAADTVRESLRTMLGFVRDSVLRQPTHEGYLANTIRNAA